MAQNRCYAVPLEKNPHFYDNGNLNLYVMHSLKKVYLIDNSIPFTVPFI